MWEIVSDTDDGKLLNLCSIPIGGRRNRGYVQRCRAARGMRVCFASSAFFQGSRGEGGKGQARIGKEREEKRGRRKRSVAKGSREGSDEGGEKSNESR